MKTPEQMRNKRNDIELYELWKENAELRGRMSDMGQLMSELLRELAKLPNLRRYQRQLIDLADSLKSE